MSNVCVEILIRATFFGTTSGFWLGLQADYVAEEAAKKMSGVLAQILRVEPLAA